MTRQSMFKTTAIAALITASLGIGGAVAQPAGDVRVTIDLENVSDSSALPFYDKVEADLTQAIAGKLDIQGGDGTNTIAVDVRRMALDGTPVGPGATQFNELDGVIRVDDASEGQTMLSYPLRLAAYTSEPAVQPEGVFFMLPDDDDFYAAMIDAFATQVATVYGDWFENRIKDSSEDR